MYTFECAMINDLHVRLKRLRRRADQQRRDADDERPNWVLCSVYITIVTYPCNRTRCISILDSMVRC